MVGALGFVLLAGGVAVFAVANSVDLGWSAYTPLDAGEPAAYQSELLLFSDGSVVWNRRHAVGAGLAVLGLLALAVLGGWLLGRRSASRSS